MEDLSLHILDVVENSILAGAKRIEIKVHENIAANLLLIKIKDDGKGMDEDTLKKILDPFFTTKRAKKVGLGLSLLAQAAKESGGLLEVKSKKNKGTTVSATFQDNHIDRKPMGNMAQTMMTLIVGNKDVDFLYQHKKGNLCYCLDTTKIKNSLEGVPINDPAVIKAIQKDLEKNLR